MPVPAPVHMDMYAYRCLLLPSSRASRHRPRDVHPTDVHLQLYLSTACRSKALPTREAARLEMDGSVGE